MPSARACAPPYPSSEGQGTLWRLHVALCNGLEQGTLEVGHLCRWCRGCGGCAWVGFCCGSCRRCGHGCCCVHKSVEARGAGIETNVGFPEQPPREGLSRPSRRLGDASPALLCALGPWTYPCSPPSLPKGEEDIFLVNLSQTSADEAPHTRVQYTRACSAPAPALPGSGPLHTRVTSTHVHALRPRRHAWPLVCLRAYTSRTA